MLFSSISFLYYFLPAVLVIYFIVPYRFKNIVLLISSLFFYFYGEPVYCLLMVFTSLSGYIHGLWIEQAKGTRFHRIPMLSSVVISIGVLGFFKYTDFFIININQITNSDIPLFRIALPIGISFYTFQTLSYTIDVYRGSAKVQKNPLDLAAYVALFPQLIAGPIVRYTTVEEELGSRTHSFENFAYGVNRFIIGLSKKVLLANTLGELGRVFADSNNRTVLFYWIAAFAFVLQIYFDFSGYSDMAIGLGKIFGFHFLENFNYPYISKSITEFWRRWHISLGTWFRDYVYIPLGGNRVPPIRWVFNVFVVWFLTGFWHGAEWNFIAWGVTFAVLLILEKLLLKKRLDKLPVVFRHVYVIFFVTITFVIFNANSLGEGIANMKGMFGALKVPFSNSETLYYLRSYAFIFIISIIGATPLPACLIKKARNVKRYEKISNCLEPVFHIVFLLLITGYLIDSSFNPFIYFRF